MAHDLSVGRNSRILWLLVACCVSMALWMVFAKLVAPSLIEAIYRGESFSILNSVIKGQAEFPLEHYLQKWNYRTMVVLWSGIGCWLLAMLMTSPFFFKRFVGEATPGTLGAIRVWVCFILLISTLWEDLPSFALLPLELREDMGLMKIFDALPIGYQSFLTSGASLRLFQWLTILLIFLAMIGWRTRIVVPLGTLCVLVLNGILREYSGYWHQNLVTIYVLAVLSFTPCGDGWSVDRLRKVSLGHPVPDPERTSSVYGWARYACWVAIALPYVEAGLSKLRSAGVDWMSATNMKNMLLEQTLYPRAGNWSISLSLASAPDIVFVGLSIAGSVGEIMMISLLFSRIARRIYPALMIFMHIGIVFLMNIVFFDLMLILLVFYDFTSVLTRIGKWLGAASRLQVLYDGFCPLCCRTVRILTCLDLFHRLDFQDFRRLDIADYNHRHKLNLRPEDLEKAMYVISEGRSSAGFCAYRMISLAVPVLWPLVPFLFLPGASVLGAVMYRFVARNRLKLATCDSSCPLEVSATGTLTFAPPSSSPRYNLSFGLAVAGLIAVMGSIWALRIEYYPLTAMPMFTSVRRSVVTYFKTLGHRESGAISPIYLEDSLGAVSINSRYEPLFDFCFSNKPRDLEICKKTLSVLGIAYNKKTPPGEKVTRYEIQRWTWDFVSNPQDSNYGTLDARMVFDISSGSITRQDTVH
jgi:predicted DCC family thiol-disulfide oxidoreductase YuxK